MHEILTDFLRDFPLVEFFLDGRLSLLEATKFKLFSKQRVQPRIPLT